MAAAVVGQYLRGHLAESIVFPVCFDAWDTIDDVSEVAFCIVSEISAIAARIGGLGREVEVSIVETGSYKLRLISSQGSSQGHAAEQITPRTARGVRVEAERVNVRDAIAVRIHDAGEEGIAIPFVTGLEVRRVTGTQLS